ncbi:hypothetical protein [Paraburkholderia sediminicola]|uniref:hypothetical protein n=1 Tax=Paraburkholderia sediminicola TaxID=458836 RepID=UPI0038BD191B
MIRWLFSETLSAPLASGGQFEMFDGLPQNRLLPDLLEYASGVPSSLYETVSKYESVLSAPDRGVNEIDAPWMKTFLRKR